MSVALPGFSSDAIKLQLPINDFSHSLQGFFGISTTNKSSLLLKHTYDIYEQSTSPAGDLFQSMQHVLMGHFHKSGSGNGKEVQYV